MIDKTKLYSYLQLTVDTKGPISFNILTFILVEKYCDLELMLTICIDWLLILIIIS